MFPVNEVLEKLEQIITKGLILATKWLYCVFNKFHKGKTFIGCVSRQFRSHLRPLTRLGALLTD